MPSAYDDEPLYSLGEDSPGERELFHLALAQTGLDVTLHAEQNIEAALHFLAPQAANIPGCPPDEVTGTVSTTRIEREPAQAAHSATTETMPVTSPPLPSPILLDLNLRRQNGCNLLRHLRSDARLTTLPIVGTTTSDDPANLANLYRCEASGYVINSSALMSDTAC